MIDHAELARLAEAASARLAGPNLNADGFGLQIWGDSLKGGSTHVLDVRGWGYLTGGGHGALGLSEDDGIAAQRAIQAYAVAAWTAVPALLSEIAALRGEVERVEAGRIRTVDDRMTWTRRTLEAERQRDELRKALEPFATYPLAVKMDGTVAPDEYQLTGRHDKEGIFRTVTNGDFQRARQALANQGADPAPVKKERAWICPQDNTPCPPECDSDDRRHCASVACKEKPA